MGILEELKYKKLVVFGTGSYQRFFDSIARNYLEYSYYVDNDKEKQGKMYSGKVVAPPTNLIGENKSKVLIIIASSFFTEISLQLKRMGFIEHLHFKSASEVLLSLYIEKRNELDYFYRKSIMDFYLLDDDMEDNFIPMVGKTVPYSLTLTNAKYNLYKSVEYIVKNNLPGDFVECGVWHGGSAMIMALSLIEFGDTSRRIYLYDTYDEMPDPTEKDVSWNGTSLFRDDWNELGEVDFKKNYSTEDNVLQQLYSTGYPRDKIITVKGKVEETIPQTVPGNIALLRLDTDWYVPTYHQFVHLYPLLVQKGVLIVDDYGVLRGAREATDQYFEENNINILMTKVNMSVRFAIKI
ncbi:class I SAM-dependent methyltransferase [Cohnella xylanilytica]|uniref:Class I SAM-dependent methyltransferase n=1 Tax=Cohnella xylanilytica TaxID=557555 RepID=A0A841TUK9_9BACL|nr:TylF/MycF/NovP-related O-methyltransferase [Cohnella xylanilytica]MBB6692217.1 class I SAM-dependent methyltransferase [Cohnella xylanilytica]